MKALLASEYGVVFVVIGAIWFNLLLYFLFRFFGHLAAKRAYNRARREFWRQVRAGNRPETAPVFIDEKGGMSVNPADLLQCARVQRQLAAIKKLKDEGKIST